MQCAWRDCTQRSPWMRRLRLMDLPCGTGTQINAVKFAKLFRSRKKLASLCAWVTAIRREQTTLRKNAGKVEWDSRFELVKINPIADWTRAEVWEYIEKHQLAYNPMHDQGYPSIGCIQCTAPVSPDAHPRSGRWANSSKMECGLHQPADEKCLLRPPSASTDDEKRSAADK